MRKVLYEEFSIEHGVTADFRIEALGKPVVWVHQEKLTTADWTAQAARDLFFCLAAHPEGLTKAEIGEHDENIDFNTVVKKIGKEAAGRVRDITLAIYQRACELAEPKGIIIADTKLEFGFYQNELILIDEVLTPDSSRFWPKADYQEGVTQKSFDKQFVRNYLLSLTWNQKPPAPALPDDVVKKTSEKYLEVLKMLTS